MERPTETERLLFGCLGGCFLSIVLLVSISIAVAFWVNRDHNVPPVGYNGDPQRGEALLATYGCNTCHSTGAVGPPFTHMASRSYIAGRFPNIQIWMTEWIEHPQRLKPGTAMPELGVSEHDARDMAAYLAMLK
jgi:cytochrome c